MELNEAAVRKLQELAEKATPGPWEVVPPAPDSYSGFDSDPFVGMVRNAGGWYDEDSTVLTEANAEYIAAADSSTVAALCDSWLDQGEALAAAKDALDSICNELGVPTSDYPMPVGNAYWIARKALASLSDISRADKEPEITNRR